MKKRPSSMIDLMPRKLRRRVYERELLVIWLESSK